MQTSFMKRRDLKTNFARLIQMFAMTVRIRGVTANWTWSDVLSEPSNKQKLASVHLARASLDDSSHHSVTKSVTIKMKNDRDDNELTGERRIPPGARNRVTP